MSTLNQFTVVKVALALAACSLSAPTSADEETTVKVFKRVSPSVVSLESSAGSGTGILLTSQGTILTNAHVVAVPLPFRCRVEVLRNGKPETVVFKRVTVLSFHPQLDLALLKIDPAEHGGTLQPANLHKTKGQTGQQVFAIGNPPSAGASQPKTITTGLLSGVDRQIEGVAYYQFSAPIDPGNSGGPLCDNQGDVLGLVTLKSSDAENIGFAIPLHDLSTAQFVPSKEWPSDPKKAFQLIDAGSMLWSKSERAPPALRELYQQLSLQFYQEALLHNPRSTGACDMLARSLVQLKRYDEAEGYLWAALQMNSWAHGSMTYLGFGDLMIARGKPEEAVILWREGLAKQPVGLNLIWSKMAWHYARKKDWVRAMSYATEAAREKGNRGGASLSEITISTRFEATDAQKKRIDSMIKDEPFKHYSDRVRRFVALKRGKPAITREFADFVKRSGYRLPAPKLVEDAINMVDVDTAKHVDLLAAVQGDRLGDWLVRQHKMKSPAAGMSTITLPDAESALVDGSYSLYIEAERRSGANELIVAFPANGALETLAIDSAGSKTGIVGAQEGQHQAPVLAKGKLVDIVIDVHPDLIRVSADGEGIVWLRAKLPAAASAAKEDLRLSLGSRDSEFVIHAIHAVALRPIAEAIPRKVAGKAPKSTSPRSPTASPGSASKSDSTSTPVHREFTGLGKGVQSLAFAPGGRFLAAGKDDRAFFIYDLEKNSLASRMKDLRELAQVKACAFSPDGRQLFTAGSMGPIKIWDIDFAGQPKEVATFSGHRAEVRLLAVSPDGKHVLSADRNRLRYWQVEGCRQEFAFADLEKPVAIHIAADGTRAAASDGLTLIWFDLPSGEVRERLTLKKHGVAQCGAFSADGRRIAVNEGYEISVFDVRQGTLEATIKPGELPWAMVFSGDGNTLIAGLMDKCRVWTLADGIAERDVLLGHRVGYIQNLALSADGRYLAVAPAGSAATLKVIDLTTLHEKK